MKIDRTTKATGVRNVERASKLAPPAPAEQITAVDEISVLGVPDAELTPKVRAAIVSLVEDLRELRAELERSRTRIQELEALADRDPMLDILNRRAFVRELNRVLAMIDRYDVRASLVFVDLNDLKIINDDQGHGAGDAALAHVAGVISENVRQTDVVARIGGDEFAIVLMQADQAVASAKASAIADLIARKPVTWDGPAFHAAVSWGAVQIRKGASAQEALNLADEAMYEAKRMKE
jgi:diguanylate cyclase (GGDEF)-like protein